MSARAALAAVTAATTYLVLSRVLAGKALAHYTVVNDLDDLGRGRTHKLPKTVVICGGSIAGLLAARVCVDHFEHVIVIDPDQDALFSEPALLSGEEVVRENGTKRNPRARVHQYLALHASQALNLLGLERLFPGFRAALEVAGSPVGPVENYTHFGGHFVPAPWAHYGGALPEWFTLSRAGYKPLLRRHVADACGNVRFVAGTVAGVVRGADGRLAAVAYRPGADASVTAMQDADLVIDCTGPAHAGLTWLVRAGYALDANAMTERYHPHMCYTNCEFAVDPAEVARIVPGGFNRARLAVRFTINQVHGTTRYLAICHIERDRIALIVGGHGYEHKTRSVAEIRDFADALELAVPLPAWHGALLDYLESVEDTATFIYTQSPGMYYIKYEEHAHALPGNFIALGDAVSQTNPIYGAGMTKVMVGAVVLNTCLRSFTEDHIPDTFGAQFFASLHTKTWHVWQAQKHADYGNEVCEPAAGESRRTGALARWYQLRLLGLQIRGDEDIIRRAFDVREWLGPPTLLFAPRVLGKVLWAVLTGA